VQTRNRESGIAVRLFHQAAHRGSGNVVPLGDLGQGQSRSAVKDDLLAVNIEPCATYGLAEPTRHRHAGFHALYHKRPFEFCNRRDDRHEKTPHRIPRRHAFSAADKLDSQTVQFVHYLQKVPSAPRNPVESRDQHDGKLLPSRIRHEGVETRTACLLATNTSIFVFVGDLEASLCRQLSKIVQLRFDMLVGRANPDVYGCFFHVPPPSLYAV